jgi:hypothetical protein
LLLGDTPGDFRDEVPKTQPAGTEEGSDAEDHDDHSSEELEMDPIKMIMS